MQVRGTFPELNSGMMKRARSGSARPGSVPNKVGKVMHEFKERTLRSGGSGKAVTSRKQAVAIGLSEQRKEQRKADRGGFSGFALKRAPRPAPIGPKHLTGRRNLSHALGRAYKRAI